jgi:protein-S-isoprenylcysteine O-methyltransferase Ste14
MSIWQNFKDTDHEFERKFFGFIFLGVLALGGVFLIMKFFDQIPDVTALYGSSKGSLYKFFIAACIILFVTQVFYERSLGVSDCENPMTKKIIIISITIWILFWIAWSSYCAWLTKNYNPMTTLVRLTLILLVFVPGFAAFLFSRNVRLEQLEEDKCHRERLGDEYHKFQPPIIYLKAKYYSGYYGLICLPIYIICLLLGDKIF